MAALIFSSADSILVESFEGWSRRYCKRNEQVNSTSS